MSTSIPTSMYCQDAHLSIQLTLTSQPFGATGDSDLVLVFDSLSRYRSDLRDTLEKANPQDEPTRYKEDKTRISQLDDLINEIETRVTIAIQDQIKAFSPAAYIEKVLNTSRTNVQPLSEPVAAKPPAQATSEPDSTMVNPVIRKQEEILEIVSEFMSEDGMASPINLLTQLWTFWSIHHIAKGEAIPGDSHSITTEALDETYSIMRLMHFLSAIGEWHAQEKYFKLFKQINPHP